MKALDYLYAMKCANEQMDQEPISIYEAIEELETLKLYVKYLEEYKRLARDYLQIQRCSCGTLKVKDYLCSNKDCEEK